MERRAFSLAGPDAVDCGRTPYVAHGVGDYDLESEQRKCEACALGSWKQRKPFVMIYSNTADETDFPNKGFSQKAFVFTPRGELFELFYDERAMKNNFVVNQEKRAHLYLKANSSERAPRLFAE